MARLALVGTALVVVVAAALTVAGADLDLDDAGDDEVSLPDEDEVPPSDAAPASPQAGVECLEATDCVLWRADIDPDTDAADVDLAAADGTVIVRVGDRLRALDADGATRWAREVTDLRQLLPVADPLLAVTDDGLLALDAGSGALRWSAPHGDDVVPDRSAPLRAERIGDVVVLAVQDTAAVEGSVSPEALPETRLRAHDAGDGTPRWGRTEDDVRLSGSAIVVADHDDGRIAGVDPGSGTTLWRTRPIWSAEDPDVDDGGDGPSDGASDGPSDEPPGGDEPGGDGVTGDEPEDDGATLTVAPGFQLMLVDDAVAVTRNVVEGGEDEELVVYSAASGGERFRHRDGVAGHVAGPPLLLLEGGDDDRRLVAVETDGSQRWERPLGWGDGCCARARHDGEVLLLAGPEDGRLQVADLATGRTRHDLDLGGEGPPLPMAVDGLVLAHDPDGRWATAIDADDGRELWRLEGAWRSVREVDAGVVLVILEDEIAAVAHGATADAAPPP